MPSLLRHAIALAFTGIALTFVATPAHASVSETQDRVDHVIATYGGVQTAWNEVSWNDGDVVLTISDPDTSATLAFGPCASGKYCLYESPGYTGTVLTFSSCTTGNPIAPLAQVRSIANSRTTGTVRAYDGAALVATVAPNTGKTPIASTVTTVSCS